MPKPKPTYSNQDSFDKAFITVLYELQKIGFCKNVAKIEELLGFPKRILYQVLDGHRSVPKLRRHTLLKFFTDNYNVNPRVFVNNAAPLFNDHPPTHEDQPEAYFTKNNTERGMMTMGDFVEMDRLRRENEACKAQVKELKKLVKNWQALADGKSKTGHKTGQKKKG